MMRRVSDLSDSWSDSWKTPRWPSSPRSPRTPSKTADHHRAARWSKREAEIKQADEAPRTKNRYGKPIEGDKTTDCIYTITIDGKAAYVGQTNDFEERMTNHKRLMDEMKAKNPGSVVKMESVHVGIKKGPQLDAMEKYYMEEVFCTLAIKGDDEVGEGVNKYRWNKNRAPSTKSDAFDALFDASIPRLHICDGPSSERCVGNLEPWTPTSIATTIESVKAIKATRQATRDDDEESRDLGVIWGP
jgi:hypothetical protein